MSPFGGLCISAADARSGELVRQRLVKHGGHPSSPRVFLIVCGGSGAEDLLDQTRATRTIVRALCRVGRYMWLSCVASSPGHARSQYAIDRERRSSKAKIDVDTCAGDLDCLARVNTEIDDHLMRCLAYQRENAKLIASLAPATISQCGKDKLQ